MYIGMYSHIQNRSVNCIAGQLNDEEAAEMVNNMQLAAPEVDSVLVQLLSEWAERGRDGSPRSQVAFSDWQLLSP